MAKVYAMIADGTEECECLIVVDVLRRAGADVRLVSVGGKTAVGSHGIEITADATVSEVDLIDADLIFVPGGLPGSEKLAANAKLVDAIGKALELGKRVAAVCAAPALVLGAHGFLRGKSAICFPGFESHMSGAEIKRGARVVTDGNVTTARGLGCTLELALELVRLLFGSDKAAEIKQKIQAD